MPISRKDSRRMRRRLFAPQQRDAAAQRMRDELARRRADPAAPALDLLLLAVSAEFRVEAADVAGSRRFPQLVEARWAFALLARRRLRARFQAIGAMCFADHDAPVPWRWLQRAQALAAANPRFAARVRSIERDLWPADPAPLARAA